MRLTLFFAIFSTTMASAAHISGQSMETVKVNIAVKEVPLKQVLHMIETQSSFSIGYDMNSIPTDSRISYNATAKPVSAVLKELLKTFAVDIVQINDKYVLIQPAMEALRQQVRITGKITDNIRKEPIPGVSISIKGTTSGTQTDADGRFSIGFPANKEAITLVVYSLGFKKKEIVLQPNNSNGLNIVLEEDRLGLDEIVVTGQGVDIAKRRLSSNVVSIGAKDIEDVPAGRLDQLLQSRLPNAQIKLTGGQAGATSLIRARGVNSALVNSTPVIYVDGVRMDNLNTASAMGGGSTQGAAISAIADIPMDNIEKIEYINGGAATTLYGSDAANGVIQIFTKKGGAGKTTINVETQLGAETPTTDFLHFKRTKELLMQNGFYQKHHLGINGGQERFGFSFSGNYMNAQGTQIFGQNNNRKVDFSTGFRAGLGNKVTYESSFTYVNNKYKRNRNGNQGGYTGLWFAESGASAITGPGFKSNLDSLTDTEFERMKNYVHEAEKMQDNDITINRFQTSQTFKYTPVKGLVIKAAGGIDYRVQKNQVITTNKYLSFTTGNPIKNEGSITNNDRKYLGITLELNAQHELKINDFSFVTTLGGQYFRNEDQQMAYNGTNVRDGARTIKDATSKTSDEFYLEVVNYGLYLQENIGFKNKFFLDLGIRGDGNPAFGSNIGIQYYPKAGFSYVPSAENWFEGIAHVITSAKIRGGFGIAGNLPPAFSHERTIAFKGYNGEQSAFFGQTGNDNLKPEKTQTLEGGMDLGFLKDRLLFSVGYYNSITRGALFNVPPTPSSGQPNSQHYNVGSIRNKGWEFSVTAIPVETQHLSLRVNASLNTLYNNVENAGTVAPFNLNGFSSRTIQTVVQQGYPIGFLRGNYGQFDANGVYLQTTPLEFLGTTIPNLFGSFGLNLRYKQFNFFANADYQKGAYANSFDRQFRFNYAAGNEGIPQAEIDKNGRKNWLNFTNMFTEKTDYIKVRLIGLTYNWKPAVFGKVVKSATLGFSAVNPLNFASSSFDPEATISGSAQGQGGATTGGISYSTYSAPRQFIGSIRLNF
ncbi:TonB-dependent receptor domain-containing protein [Chitinophaga nivalis]|uniref:TonB-dependent receptor n=1 Tax=Chitinophaga nivalis TaxID=2991709 RepID=A0ABT3INP4_9BACT|nr:TonB-dependent receptor [Chitinophaga nivalis]MCW3464724.1 TonB-dependent receptor [Chitinophaga nivalis]MCW3485585.1 TonB-dependent receptor [Chitinophaga nivalis]